MTLDSVKQRLDYQQVVTLVLTEESSQMVEQNMKCMYSMFCC